jgi:protein TonB
MIKRLIIIFTLFISVSMHSQEATGRGTISNDVKSDIKPLVDLKGAMLQGSNSLASNSALIPLVRIAPRYPREALVSGKTGFVTIKLTVDEDGKVIDATISNSKPPKVFDKAALQAVLRWKFKPRVVNGVPVQQVGTTTIEFNL